MARTEKNCHIITSEVHPGFVLQNASYGILLATFALPEHLDKSPTHHCGLARLNLLEMP